MTRYHYVWATLSGEVYDLTTGDRGVHLAQGGAEGLPRSVEEAQTVAIPGAPGVRTVSTVTHGASGSFTVACFAHDGMSAGEVEARFIEESSRGGTMTVTGASSRSALLERPSFSAPPHQPAGFTVVTVDVDLDRGLWDEHRSGSGVVDVVNAGEALLYPRVTWQQGGDLVVPSGATIALPTVPGPRVLDLDPEESGVVTTPDGDIDEAVWGSFKVWPEGVPERESRAYRLPEGATLSWALGYRRPWT